MSRELFWDGGNRLLLQNRVDRDLAAMRPTDQAFSYRVSRFLFQDSSGERYMDARIAYREVP